MQVKTVSLGKHYKCGLPNFSNITSSVNITWELAEGEDFNFPKAWDVINGQLSIQGRELDQSWLIHKETKDTYKTVIVTPKA